MHQIAQIWTYIFTNFPGPQNWGGVSPLFLGARVYRPTYLELPRPLPPIRTPNMQRDFTNHSYIYKCKKLKQFKNPCKDDMVNSDN